MRRNSLMTGLGAVLLALTLAGCGPTEMPQSGTAPGDSHSSTAAAPGGSHEAGGNAPAANAPADETPKVGLDLPEKSAGGGGATAGSKTPHVVMETSEGAIELELNAEKAPITVKNFLEYVQKGHYSGTVFHRVISDFMIQGGGYTPDGNEKPTGSGIQNEAQNGLKNTRGTIAMARTSDPNSATAQFFINVVDNTSKLDYPNPDGFGYAVFGKVVKGMDVVDKIRAVQTGSDPMPDWPVKPPVIKSVKVK